MRGHRASGGHTGSTMSATTKPAGAHRDTQLALAIRLEYLSVIWGIASASWSMTAGLLSGSLGVLGVGLEVAADVAGSATLIWRFRTEQQDLRRAGQVEARASCVVTAALVMVVIFLSVEAVRALIVGSAPASSVSAMVSAGAAAAVLTPLGIAKYRLGSRLGSHALRGDGTLSLIAAGLGAVALLALGVDHLCGWWWADRVAALAAAAVAGWEAVRVFRSRARLREIAL